MFSREILVGLPIVDENTSITAPLPTSDVIVVIPGTTWYPPPDSVTVISSIDPYVLVDIVVYLRVDVVGVYEVDSGNDSTSYWNVVDPVETILNSPLYPLILVVMLLFKITSSSTTISLFSVKLSDISTGDNL